MLNLHNVKLTYKRTLVCLSIITLLMSGVTLPAPIPSPLRVTEVNAQAVCSPAGTTWVGSAWTYDWIANGIPERESCWNRLYTVRFVTGTNTCGAITPGTTAWEFGAPTVREGWKGQLSQTFTVSGENKHATGFTFVYDVDFIDPHDDPWNRLHVTIYDLTTGTLLASDSISGGERIDLYCSRRPQTWYGNLADHTLEVRFSGIRGYDDSIIRIRNIQLWQFFA